MTRKDYVLIAEAFASARETRFGIMPSDLAQHRKDCGAVADALARDNARFDRDRFLRACGLTVQS